MTKLPSSDKVISVLLDYGFVFKSQKGIHQKYKNREKTVIVPAPRKQIPIGTLKSISKQSGIAYSEFYKSVKNIIAELLKNPHHYGLCRIVEVHSIVQNECG